MGLTPHPAKFVKKYFDLAGEMERAVRSFADEVATGAFPAPEHSYR
jgi:3-methyl-2-oxobutanoate hydroxymethyltransferase